MEGVAQTSRQILDQTSHAGSRSLLERQHAPQLVAGKATESALPYTRSTSARAGRTRPLTTVKLLQRRTALTRGGWR